MAFKTGNPTRSGTYLAVCVLPSGAKGHDTKVIMEAEYSVQDDNWTVDMLQYNDHGMYWQPFTAEVDSWDNYPWQAMTKSAEKVR